MNNAMVPVGSIIFIMTGTYIQRRNKFLIANNDLQELAKGLTVCPRIHLPVNALWFVL